MDSAKQIVRNNLYETPVKPRHEVVSARLTNTLSVFRKKNYHNIYETLEEGHEHDPKNLMMKKMETNKQEFIEEILKSNIGLRSKVSKSGLIMDTPALEPYVTNINKIQRVGDKRVQPIYLETIRKQLIEIYEGIKNDQHKEKDIYFPRKKDSIGPNQIEMSQVTSKKEKKKLRKRLKIYDENYAIAMSFVKALSKSLLLLGNDKHELPTNEDFDLENMISLSNLNKDIYDYCEFIDVAPLVFQRIRFIDGIANDEFIRDIGFNDFKAIFLKKMKAMKEEKSTGKSGSIFFQSSNGKYFIKTIRVSEVDILKKTLRSYYSHLKNHPNSLLSRYYGLHKLRFYKNKKQKKNFYLVIMNNVFHNGTNPIAPESIFDLKGSTYKRRTSKEKLDKNAAGKDLNFLDIIRDKKLNIEIQKAKLDKLLETIKADSIFLSENNIIDYR